MKTELVIPWLWVGLILSVFGFVMCFFIIKRFVPKREKRHIVLTLALVAAITGAIESYIAHSGYIVATGKEGLFGRSLSTLMFSFSIVLPTILMISSAEQSEKENQVKSSNL